MLLPLPPSNRCPHMDSHKRTALTLIKSLTLSIRPLIVTRQSTRLNILCLDSLLNILYVYLRPSLHPESICAGPLLLEQLFCHHSFDPSSTPPATPLWEAIAGVRDSRCLRWIANPPLRWIATPRKLHLFSFSLFHPLKAHL